MSGQKLNIVYRNFGIADRFDDGTIELHRGLKEDKFRDLRNSIIKHEIRHTDKPGFTKKDFLHDISTPDQMKTGLLLKFMMRYPSSLVQFLPVYWTKRRGVIVDINLSIIYSAVGLIAGGIVFWGLSA